MMSLFYFSLFGTFLFKKNLQLDFKQDKLFHMKYSLSYRCVFHVKQRGKMEKQIIASIEKAKTDLKHYLDLLNNWQKAVNLISSSTLETAWHRHIMDSAQLYPLIPDTASSLVDMGSGAGFPGLVLAILNKANNGFLKDIFLVESDLKKCLFLKEVSRQLSVPVTVLNQRLETLSNISADVVTARALAPFEQLLQWGKSFITPHTTCLFLKGENSMSELSACSVSCHVEKIKSITNTKSFIIKATEVIYE